MTSSSSTNRVRIACNSLTTRTHIIGATVILGTGSGLAFFMLMAHMSRDAAFVAHLAAHDARRARRP
jgi:uncharacterized membrane protein